MYNVVRMLFRGGKRVVKSGLTSSYESSLRNPGCPRDGAPLLDTTQVVDNPDSMRGRSLLECQKCHHLFARP